mgnify:CR=1 FL=1
MSDFTKQTVLIKKLSEFDDFEFPDYQTDQASGVDLKASIENSLLINPWEKELIPTGVALSIPKGMEAQIRPRSGLALKHGITVLNSPGTIDSDYRGEIKIILINLSNNKFEINRNDRIAQMVFAKVSQVNFKAVNDLDDTIRGEGGFGSTGN